MSLSGISVNAQSGYNSKTKIKHNFTKKSKLCSNSTTKYVSEARAHKVWSWEGYWSNHKLGHGVGRRLPCHHRQQSADRLVEIPPSTGSLPMKRWTRRHVLTAAALGCMVLAAVVVAQVRSTNGGSGADDGPNVKVLTQNIELVHRTNSRVTSFMVAPICLTATGNVTVTSIKAIDARGGAHVTDFSIFPASRLGDTSPAETDLTIAQSPIFNGVKVLRQECDGTADQTMLLAVEVSRPSSKTFALTQGLRIRYDSGQRSVDVPFDLGLCSDPKGC